LSYARGGHEIAQVPAGWAGGSRQGDGKCRFRRSLPEGRNTSVARAHLTCGGEQSRTLKRWSVYRLNRIGFRAEPTAKKNLHRKFASGCRRSSATLPTGRDALLPIDHARRRKPDPKLPQCCRKQRLACRLLLF